MEFHTYRIAMQHDETTKFIAYCLWLAGYGAGTIAHWLGMRRSQVLGLCQRGPWGARSSMTLKQRQAALEELRQIRVGTDKRPIDQGKLNRFDWVAMPLEAAQRRPSARSV